MVKIEPFEVEQWMDRYEVTPGVINIAETCAASVSIDELVDLSRDKTAPGPLDTSKKLTYGAIPGSKALRERVASLLDRGASLTETRSFPPENVIITQGAISANFLLIYTLIGPGDHVICVYPTYQQLYDVPKSLGAEVSLWKLKEENGYIPDISELEGLVKPNTKLIIINNPNNPTGSTTPKSVLSDMVEFARSRDITILSDEVYSPLYHSLPADQEAPPSILTFGYNKTVATGSMSKAFALAGIRVGWVASRDSSLIKAVSSARDYTTISVSQLDDQVASYALSKEVLASLMKRNLELAKTNLGLLAEFVDKYSQVCSWVRPTAGTTALIKFTGKGKDGKREPVKDGEFVVDLLEETKVLVMPGSVCFGKGEDFEGTVRIGYVCHTEVLREGLEKMGAYVEQFLL
ncbi:pyridoxal phosphate-dependent transferase [Rhypophila decipiens]|uniref:Pyridoxal phosphate-dependent transferase n=1 Tax=Rhypophila decipiens TaxID=261697 RepID=A0AAN6YHW5_9PEZI|nr:pyridoxal phosphate-dependent transferase [Rhypophila decipiens]